MRTDRLACRISSRWMMPDVYSFARHLARGFDCRYVVAVECGNGDKPATCSPRFSITRIDADAHLDERRRRHAVGTCPVPDEILRESIVICVDVIEHLVDPMCLLHDLRRMLDHARVGLLSTPERHLVRAIDEPGSPANPPHVRRWNLAELTRLLEHSGFQIEFAGLTGDNSQDLSKQTSLVVLRNHWTSTSASRRNFRVTAIMTAYNESDIIEPSIRKLVNAGVEVYVIDNWSTDGTYEIVKRLESGGMVCGVERWPTEGPARYDRFEQKLRRVGALTSTLDSDWFIHHDVDEVRSAPWKGVSLKDGLKRVDIQGFNAVDHTVVAFPAVDNGYAPGADFEQHFRHFKFGRPNPQVKAWKNLGRPVDLAETGGHLVNFEGRRVYPYKFLLKHYPIRSESHGARKILRDRLPRYEPEERAKGWHTHYDDLAKSPTFLHKVEDLQPYDTDRFARDYLVERLSGVGISGDQTRWLCAAGVDRAGPVRDNAR